MRLKATFLLLAACLFSNFLTAQTDPGPGDSVESVGVVEIRQNRLKEKLKESPLTVESMSAQSIKETPASDFYEALGHLKGVDITAASLGFRIVNTRGFNSTSPVRTLQVIDGVDNQSPGLNFSLGNFLGASELDVANQEIVVGASSAFYGPGAFNGVISFTTKDPWKHTGLQVKQKFGERSLTETSLRYAKVLSNDQGRDVFAFKFNLSYMQAYDWEATNADPTPDSKVGMDNPGGYDAVNRYGDEILRPGENDATSRDGMYNVPGLGIYHRDGYWEKDLVDYNTNNLKSSFMAALRPWKNSSAEFQYQVNFGNGTTVYQGDNRYSLKDIKFLQNRLEYKDKNGFIRVYATHEDAGNTYDAVFTALLMQNYAKRDDLWGGDYYRIWQSQYRNKVKALAGYPKTSPFSDPEYYDKIQAVLDANREQIAAWHNECRQQANYWHDFQGRPFPQQPNTFDRYYPGTERFDSLKTAITSLKSFGEGGSGFYDRSALYHTQGEHSWRVGDFWKVTSGFSARLYTPNTQGTIFADTNGVVIRNQEAGLYTGTEYRDRRQHWKINLTARVDKNINFPVIFSPAASVVYTPDKVTYWRLSLTSGVRNPTLADQYLYYNVGRAILLGNINGYDSLVTLPSLFDVYDGLIPDLNKLNWFNVNPVRPERVRSVELGYKSLLADRRLSMDASAYFNVYRDFIGYQLGFDPIIDYTLQFITGGQVYRIATNAQSIVTTMGFAGGWNYFIGKNYTAGFNYSWNKLNKLEKEDPIIPAFNTPEHKFNLSFMGSGIDLTPAMPDGLKDWNWENCAFNVNFKWVQGFTFEGSPQFTGFVPTYWLVDAMLSKEIPKWDASLKIGASNLTNNMVMQVYGGPRIGRMAYASLLFEL
jgi:outer membrane receptor protein involved in Fe transport